MVVKRDGVVTEDVECDLRFSKVLALAARAVLHWMPVASALVPTVLQVSFGCVHDVAICRGTEYDLVERHTGGVPCVHSSFGIGFRKLAVVTAILEGSIWLICRAPDLK